jgi:uncharacterized protein
VLWLLGGLLAIYLSICVGMFFMEPRLLYHPPELDRRALHEDAVAFGATELTVTTEDGLPLYGWRHGSGQTLVVIFSGNAATVGGWTPRYTRLAEAGFAVLHVNYRGFPGSTGEPSQAGMERDARAVWAEALKTHTAKNIVVYGKSMGGGVAVGLLSSLAEQPKALVLESTFTSAADVGADNYPWLPVKLLMRNPYPSLERAGSIKAPTLLLHGTEDEVIASSHSERLHAAIGTSTLLLLDGLTHNDDLLSEPVAWEAMMELLKPPSD